MPPKPSSTSSSTQSKMEETSNTAVLTRLATMEASMEARLENALAGLMEKQNNITLPNNQFPQQLPLHGSQPRPLATMHDQSYFPPQNLVKPPKLHLQPFDGSNSQDWLFQAYQYFNLYQVAPNQRIELVAFSMKGDALSWYKWMFNNNQLTSWTELFKLRQTSTVTEYQTRFERLSNEVVCLTSEILLNCFLSGLNSDIARELAIQQPFSVTHAIGLAKLVESKITATKSNDWPSTCPTMNVPTNQTVGTTENPTQSSN
ncbi:hypothetical protein Lal_00021740 [Lupinus albus]|nr:hypothetical protein Lal_00021740 [Lupinus albus]